MRQFSKLWQEGSMVFVCNVIDSYDIFYIAGRVIYYYNLFMFYFPEGIFFIISNPSETLLKT